jgi:hypothetical protein
MEIERKRLTFLANVTGDSDAKAAAVLLQLDRESLHFGKDVDVDGLHREDGQLRDRQDSSRNRGRDDGRGDQQRTARDVEDEARATLGKRHRRRAAGRDNKGSSGDRAAIEGVAGVVGSGNRNRGFQIQIQTGR